MTRIELLLEAERRGILPPDKAALLAEARARGLLPGQDSTATDIAKSAGVGLAEGAIGLLGLPGDVGNAMLAVSDFVAERLGVQPPSAQARADARVLPDLTPSSSEITSAVEGVTGEFREPQTTAGDFFRTMGQFAPAAFAPGGPLARFAQVVVPAVASETAGQLTEGTPVEPFARVGGAIVGGITPAAVRRAVTPNPADATLRSQVASLEGEGVTSLSAGQRTGNQKLLKQESLLGGNAGEALFEQGKEQFTAAVLRRVGVSANRATPDVIDDTITSIGRQFDDLQSRNRLAITPSLKQEVTEAIEEYKNLVPKSEQVDAVTKLPEAFRGLTMTGDQFKGLRSRLTRAARGTNDPEKARTLHRIVNALDDGMELTIRAVNPPDLGAWQEVRRRFRNMLVVERAALGAGEDAARGLISPAKLRQASVAVEGGRNFLRNRSEFSELARSGVSVMTPPRTSGTPEGMIALGLGSPLLGIPVRAAGRARVSRLGQQFLGNQALTGAPRQLGAIKGGALAGGLSVLAP